MDRIESAIERVTKIITEMTSASLEQSRGFEQVGVAVEQMDKVTQQNAALVEEATAATGLDEQANCAQP
ncbi:UNVERIFIED_ORG: methyl-accepting chemotaxis protein [Burkholderia sp. 1595]|uniref:Methyl-accepting chemotaxis protein n=1 Tax=Paraburkholderia terricola TaxID=169427 RepID=A0ABU1M2C2_9BURK|nr:methyl-accepting chemotaxis protein [Paraburkholderia terricola]